MRRYRKRLRTGLIFSDILFQIWKGSRKHSTMYFKIWRGWRVKCAWFRLPFSLGARSVRVMVPERRGSWR